MSTAETPAQSTVTVPAVTATPSVPALQPVATPAVAVQGWHPLTVTIVVAVLAVIGFFVHQQLTGYDKAMAAAQVKAQAFDQLQASDAQQFKKDQAFIAALSAQQTKVVQVETQRDAQVATTVATVKQDTTPQQVAADATKYLGATPTITSDLDLAFTPRQVDGFVVTKIEHDKFKADLASTQTLYTDEQQKTAKLTTDLATSQTETKSAVSLADTYKDIAVKTKGQKILAGIEEAGKMIAIGGAAYELGKLSAK